MAQMNAPQYAKPESLDDLAQRTHTSFQRVAQIYNFGKGSLHPRNSSFRSGAAPKVTCHNVSCPRGSSLMQYHAAR